MAEVKEKAKPFFYQARPQSKILALLIHGFTGSAYDLREIGGYLASQGINARGLRLAGHGSCPEDLAKTNAGDWWESVNTEFQTVKDRYEKICLVGYSFGANLAIDFAVRFPDIVRAIVLLGPSVYIRHDKFLRFLLPVKRIFTRYQEKKILNERDFWEYEEKGVYTKIPVKSAKEFFDFIDKYTKKEISLIRVPCLIIQSANDKVVHPKSARYVYKRVRSPKKELVILDNREHNPFFCDRRQEIFEKIARFLKASD